MAKGAQGPTPQQQRNERLQEQLMLKQLAESNKPLELPNLAAPEPQYRSAPPPSSSSADAVDASIEARRRAYHRTNAGRNTLFAGETASRLATQTLLQRLGGNPSTLG
jgi:hypothetical protein